MRIFLICILLIIAVNPTRSCLAKYVPDAYNPADDIYPDTEIDTSLNCECGKGPPGTESNASLWHVEINSTFAPNCSGSLINDRLILTTAACIINFNYATIHNTLQPPKISPGGFIVKVPSLSAHPVGIKSVECHPKALGVYVTTWELDYGICLLELNDPISFPTNSGLLPVCLSPLNSTEDFAKLDGLVAQNQNGVESNIFYNEVCNISQENSRLLCSQLRSPGTASSQTDYVKNLLLFPNIGSSLMLKSKKNQAILVGILSHKNFGPNDAAIEALPVDVNANILSQELLSFIYNISGRLGAKYCTKLPENIELHIDSQNGHKKSPNIVEQKWRPWESVSSVFRREKNTCDCGLKLADTAGVLRDASGKIFAGDDADINNFVWYAQLRWTKREENKASSCGASVINSKMILTAAHCVVDLVKWVIADPSDLEILLRAKQGFDKFEETNPKMQINKVWVHPDFIASRDLLSDVALLELDAPLKFTPKTKIYPICLPLTDEFRIEKEVQGETGIGKLIGRQATVIGFGQINAAKQTSAILQKLDVLIHPRTICDNSESPIFKPPGDGIICAGNLKDKPLYQDPSHGDSGGPLMIPLAMADSRKQQMVEIGLVSAGDYELVAGKPTAFYTSTPYYLPLIDFLSYRAGAVWCNRPKTVDDFVPGP